MPQINLNVTPEFEESLARFMRLRRIRTKTEAIRTAVVEGLQRAAAGGGIADFRQWRGAALRAPANPRPRFPADADLWKA